MVPLIIFISILSLLILAHEFGHFLLAKLNGVRVEQFSLGFGPKIFKIQKGDTEYSVGIFPLGGFVKMSGDCLAEYKGKSYEYLWQPIGKRFQIIFFGPLLNYLLGFIFFWLIMFTGYPALTTKVGGLVDGYGAKLSGLQAGDRIVSVQGVKVDFWEELQKQVQKNRRLGSVELKVLRQGAELIFNVSIKDKLIESPQAGRPLTAGLQKTPAGPGVKPVTAGILGITPFNEIVKVKHGFWESALLGAKKTYNLTLLTCYGFWQLVTGKMSVRESMTGPLGIFFITSSAASLGLAAVLHLVAVLSVSLAIFNLLPLPILDGGHIFLLGLEKLRRRPLNIKAEEIINNFGFSLIIALVIFVTYNDISRLYGEKIIKLFAKQ